MTAEEQKRYINNLIERINATDLENRAMDLVLQDLLDKQKEYEERLSKLDEMLARIESLKTSIKDEINKRKAAERTAKDLKAKLKLARLNK
jgi:flagellar capping protein FliD